MNWQRYVEHIPRLIRLLSMMMLLFAMISIYQHNQALNELCNLYCTDCQGWDEGYITSEGCVCGGIVELTDIRLMDEEKLNKYFGQWGNYSGGENLTFVEK